jgi:two-component system chemotaxis response regulator CheY
VSCVINRLNPTTLATLDINNMFPLSTRILVVDDMPSLRDLVKAYLRRMGFREIVEAGDGQEAYQILVSAKAGGSGIELIISDWNMPNLNGIDLLKLVRANPEWKNLPFLLTTTESEKHKVVEAIQSGVTNYMVKPVEEVTLKEKLERTWDKVKPAK